MRYLFGVELLVGVCCALCVSVFDVHKLRFLMMFLPLCRTHSYRWLVRQPLCRHTQHHFVRDERVTPVFCYFWLLWRRRIKSKYSEQAALHSQRSFEETDAIRRSLNTNYNRRENLYMLYSDGWYVPSKQSWVSPRDYFSRYPFAAIWYTWRGRRSPRQFNQQLSSIIIITCERLIISSDAKISMPGHTMEPYWNNQQRIFI